MKHAVLPHLSVADYLAKEERSALRHEYVNGQVYAMTGASKSHNTIVLNIAARVRPALRGVPRRVFMTDMKVHVEQHNLFYYPDVVVSCDSRDTDLRKDTLFLHAPCLIIEVLSPATETIDRREKLLAYRTLESLREYVLVSQDTPEVEVYRRAVGGEWSVDKLGKEDSLEFSSIPLTLTWDEIYVET